MASTDEWLTDQPELLELPADDDLLHVVDVSDISGSPEGTSKRIKRSNMGFSGYVEFHADYKNSDVGLINLAVIDDAPILFRLDFNGTLLVIRNNNTFPTGPELRINFIMSTDAAAGTPLEAQTPSDQPGSYQLLPAGISAFLGSVEVDEINDAQKIIISVNNENTPDKTYLFFLKIFRNWSGLTIDGKYRIADLP